MMRRWKLLLLVTVFFNLIVICDCTDLNENTEFRNLLVSEGQDVVIYPDIQASKNYSIRSPKGLLFELVKGEVKKQCPKDKCVYENSTAFLKNIQQNESGIYDVRVNFNQTVLINITVTKFLALPTPLMVPQDVGVGNGTTFDQKNENTSNVIIVVAVLIGVIAITITAVACWKWKKNRARCFRPSVMANSDPSVKYKQCNGRDPGINIAVPTPE